MLDVKLPTLSGDFNETSYWFLVANQYDDISQFVLNTAFCVQTLLFGGQQNYL